VSQEAVFFVFGGSPPYTVSNSAPSAFTLSDGTVFNSGDGFFIRTRGPCATDAVFVVRDSAGRTVTVTASNVEGAAPTPVVVAPDEVTLSSCTDSASVTIAGGTGTYFAAAGSNAILVTVTGTTATIKRRPATGSLPDPTDLQVGISDGRTNTTVDVHLIGEGATGPDTSVPPDGIGDGCP